MGVMKSDRISQLTGSTRYSPAAAILLTSSSSGKNFMVFLLPASVFLSGGGPAPGRRAAGAPPSRLLPLHEPVHKKHAPDRMINSVKDESHILIKIRYDPRCHLEFTA